MKFSKAITRRDAIRTGLLSTAALTAGAASLSGMARRGAGAAAGGSLAALDPLLRELRYPFTLAPLPYAADAFEPAIDAATMEIHHGRHHAGYVRKLNAALEDLPEWQALPLDQLLARLDELPAERREAIRNNGGGHLNHTIYWATMRPGGTGPDGALASAIDRDFGGMSALETALVAAGAGQFGSGWAWLTTDAAGKLAVAGTPNQDNPVMQGVHPLFGIDVWEHAYYLNYQNRRGDYLKAYLSLADWAAVSERYAALV